MIIPHFATKSKYVMPTRGTYKDGWPVGAVVHFTAGHDGAENTIKGGVKDGYVFWCIQKDGTLYCAHTAQDYGWHCGESKWPPLGTGLSRKLIGIEINNAGRLTKLKDGTFQSWFKTIIPADNVRYCDGTSEDQCEGYYEKYTPEQEATLIKTLVWLKSQKPDIFSFDNVLGHCEISGKLGLGYFRKNDPSAALSMTMPEFRALLFAEYEKQKD